MQQRTTGGWNRRDVVSSAVGMSLLAASGGFLPRLFAHEPAQAGKGLRVLILGGTGFLGPALVDVCKARGHSVTLFNRGKTELKKGIIDGVEKILGNRDPEKHAEETDASTPKGLSKLQEAIEAGRRWDAVIDTSAYVPRVARASAELLAAACPFYCLISTVSVYAANDQPGADESAALVTMANPQDEEVMGNGGLNYGGLKALCEAEVSKAFPNGAIIIRPGFIVGPGDPTDRFTYWPVRAGSVTKDNTQMLAPGNPNDPVQVIDVRDLAAFCVRCVESNATGTFNVTGPVKAATWGELLEACATAAKEQRGIAPELVWIDAEFLASQKVQMGVEVPIYAPGSGETAGFHTRSIARAVAAGLSTRSLLETCKDTLAWWPTEVARRERVGKQMIEDTVQAGKEPPKLENLVAMRAGMSPQREAEVLAAWRGKK